MLDASRQHYGSQWCDRCASDGMIGRYRAKVGRRRPSARARARTRRKERRELYVRFQHASAQIWDALFRVRAAGENGAEPSGDAVSAANESWIAWAKIWMEMSIVASDEVWRITEPLFEEFRSPYFHRRPPSESHEDELREQMRHELGR